jgi:chromatin remodeling complex protein RSC6
MENTQNMIPSDLKEQIIELPSTLLKISKKMVSLSERISENKKESIELFNEMKELEKLLERYMAGCIKKIKKDNEPNQRKPTGFAAPGYISDELCDFMKIDRGSLISRTQVSKFLAQYINEHNLRNHEQKNIILPDEKLLSLLGEDSKDEKITHFTIQKYMNKHFIRPV